MSELWLLCWGAWHHLAKHKKSMKEQQELEKHRQQHQSVSFTLLFTLTLLYNVVSLTPTSLLFNSTQVIKCSNLFWKDIHKFQHGTFKFSSQNTEKLSQYFNDPKNKQMHLFIAELTADLQTFLSYDMKLLASCSWFIAIKDCCDTKTLLRYYTYLRIVPQWWENIIPS